jgi:hypothetical protein
MARYEVTVPISGYAVVEVEADSEDLAIEAALDEVYDKDQIEEWTTLKDVVHGNVWYGLGSPHAHATLIGESDQEGEQ